MRQYKPLPQDLELAPTLARRLFQLRELRNLTVRDLARLSRFTIQRVEDLEAGLETWLSAPDRQKLAAALSIEPRILQEVESRPGLEQDSGRYDRQQKLEEAILSGARDLECPQCGSTLKCSVQEALDIDGNPTRFAKAFCLKCPFVLK